MRTKALVLALVVCATCSDPLPPVFGVVGDWSGTTGQKYCCGPGNLPFSFSVDTSGVRRFNVMMDLLGPVCNLSGNWIMNSGSQPFAVIKQNRFTATNPGPLSAPRFTIVGEFSSPTEASGSITAVHEQCGAWGQTTWTATKNP